MTELPRFTMNTTGAARVQALFGHMALNSSDIRPALNEIHLTLMDIEEEIFEKQGARGSAPRWPEPLYSTMMKRKRNKGNPVALIAGGSLLRSLTQKGHHLQRKRITKDKIDFGTARAFAVVHQRGGLQFGRPEIPQRQFLRIRKSDAAAFAREINRHLMRGVKKGRR